MLNEKLDRARDMLTLFAESAWAGIKAALSYGWLTAHTNWILGRIDLERKKLEGTSAIGDNVL